MELNAIETEVDYHKILLLIDKFIDAPVGSVDAKRLELLSVLMEAYEAIKCPIDDLTSSSSPH